MLRRPGGLASGRTRHGRRRQHEFQDRARPALQVRRTIGVARFDACLGGLGGCPHAPGASGNVATEDVAYLFASMGVAAGLDFERLLALRARLALWLEGETLHGTLWRAGLPKSMVTAQ